jgi:diacylglycerol kinase (ATP)
MQPHEPHNPAKSHWSRGLGHSFYCAFAGIAIMLRTQRNAKLHALATVLVIIAGTVLDVARADWCWLALAISSVFTAEALNTAIEVLADRITIEQDEAIRTAKDLSAGAVLIIGIMVLGPPLWDQLKVG